LELNYYEKKLLDNPNPTTLEYVKGQDGIAWTNAIHGIDLDKAEAAARLARESVPKLNAITPYDRKKEESYTADTLGYILMQNGHIEQALEPLKVAAAFEQNPGATFRYALALSTMGPAHEEEAVRNLKIAMARGYSPSHELYLLRDYFRQPGAFKTAFDERQPKLDLAPPGGWCH
jgi:hypothetical protein